MDAKVTRPFAYADPNAAAPRTFLVGDTHPRATPGGFLRALGLDALDPAETLGDL